MSLPQVTRILLTSYFALARAALADTVPKAVVHFLVNSVQRGLQQHLIRQLYREPLFDAMLAEARLGFGRNETWVGRRCGGGARAGSVGRVRCAACGGSGRCSDANLPPLRLCPPQPPELADQRARAAARLSALTAAVDALSAVRVA